MTASAALAAIRTLHFMLEALPESIVIPAQKPLRCEQVVKPLEDATPDDLAFAIGAVEAEFNAVGDRLHALRKLYGLARQVGAVAADRAVDVVPRDAGGR